MPEKRRIEINENRSTGRRKNGQINDLRTDKLNEKNSSSCTGLESGQYVVSVYFDRQVVSRSVCKRVKTAA